MTSAGETFVVDLGTVRSEEQLLDLLGDALELGGPDGNVNVAHPGEAKGWGKNWNALLDSLTCLDTGGIWGTSRRFTFPLKLEFANSSAFRDADPISYSILLEVLETVRGRYAHDGVEFSYVLR